MNTPTEELIGPDPVIRLWSDEYERARQAEKNGQNLTVPSVKPTVALEDFKARLTVFEKGFLSDHLRNSILASIYKISKEDPVSFATEFSPGCTYCLGVVPFDEEGYYMSESELQNPDLWLRKMRVEKDGLTEDLFNRPGFYFDLFPAELREQCKFTVPNYGVRIDGGRLIPADKDEYQKVVNHVLQAYAACFMNLRLLLDTEPAGDA